MFELTFLLCVCRAKFLLSLTWFVHCVIIFLYANKCVFCPLRRVKQKFFIICFIRFEIRGRYSLPTERLFVYENGAQAISNRLHAAKSLLMLLSTICIGNYVKLCLIIILTDRTIILCVCVVKHLLNLTMKSYKVSHIGVFLF